jgi:serine phosphatase RsbU (regulator of sigma subunit)
VNRERHRPLELRSLLGHCESIAADATLEVAHRRFAENGRDFMAVVDGERLLGVCARREISMQLGARFGFALFAQSPVRDHTMPTDLRLRETAPIEEVLASVSARANDAFYDDVLLVDAEGRFIGFIFVHALVRLQTGLLLENIGELERSRLEIAEKNRVLEDDLLMAREVQLAMLPPAGPGSDPAALWRFSSEYRPAGGVSGDFYQLMRISDTAAGVLVCDVMGHGVRSALVTAMLRAFAEDLRPLAADPGALLTRLNQCLMGVLRQTGNLLFVTAAYVAVDASSGSLAYGQAGHPTGFLRRAGGGVETLPAEGDVAGPALGLVEGFPYETGRRAVGAGDTAILFTDGLTEARSPAGEEWGEGRLRAELERAPASRPAELLAAVVAASSAFSGADAFEDDVCIVALQVGRGP